MPVRCANTRPPAKLNLFLELLARRDDGYHEIDTVMVPINWCDELSIRRSDQPGVQLNVDWLPSKTVIAQQLGIDLRDAAAASVLDVPADESNLVHRAITRFVEAFHIQGGFECDLGKRIPAGAGLGGASSDAAAALRCCAKLCDIPDNTNALWEIASSIGSDVPFFLGSLNSGNQVVEMAAARATGRGELVQGVPVPFVSDFVVVYPGVCLSTEEVYANCHVPLDPHSSAEFLSAMERAEMTRFRGRIFNRLTEPAKKLAPEIAEILKSLWRTGARTCQLTGSGSACFAIASSATDARHCAARLRAVLEPGAIVLAAHGTRVPAEVVVAD